MTVPAIMETVTARKKDDMASAAARAPRQCITRGHLGYLEYQNLTSTIYRWKKKQEKSAKEKARVYS
jgi:hypothetical protein